MAEKTIPAEVIWLAGMPRSGTSWLAQILSSNPDTRLKLCPLFSYEFKNALDMGNSRADWLRFFDDVYATPGEYLDQDFLRREGLVPTFPQRNAEPSRLVIKSNRYHDLWIHALALGVRARTVFIIRDPVDSIASWVFNPREFPETADPNTDWRSGACRKTGPGEYWGFDDWCRVTRLHMAATEDNPEHVRLIRYGDIARSPASETASLMEWLGLEMHDQTWKFLEQSHASHSGHPRAVFKDPRRLNQLRQRLPHHITRTILREVEGTPLSRFLDQPDPDQAHG